MRRQCLTDFLISPKELPGTYSAVSLLAESTQAIQVTEFFSKGISPEKFAHVYDSSEDRSHCCCRQQKSNATVGLQYD